MSEIDVNIMSNLLQSPFLILPAGFFFGVIVTLVVGRLRSSAQVEEDKSGHEHQIRALEADQRVSHKHIAELEEDLMATKTGLESRNEKQDEMNTALAARDAEVTEVKKALAVECKKTAKLRRELTGRAEETIRANAQIKDIATELDIVQAGSEVVAEQFERLAKENQDLTGRHDQSEFADIEPDEPEEENTAKKLETTGFILDS
jgi:chromosome segregation ATPase